MWDKERKHDCVYCTVLYSILYRRYVHFYTVLDCRLQWRFTSSTLPLESPSCLNSHLISSHPHQNTLAVSLSLSLSPIPFIQQAPSVFTMYAYVFVSLNVVFVCVYMPEYVHIQNVYVNSNILIVHSTSEVLIQELSASNKPVYQPWASSASTILIQFAF